MILIDIIVSFYFPKGNFIDLSQNRQIRKAQPILHPGQYYSVFCLHTLWEHARVKKLIGDQDKDAKYFSIVRDPVDLFVSFWDYYGYSAAFKMDLDTFATKNIAAYNRNQTLLDSQKIFKHTYSMLIDFGLPRSRLTDESAVAAKIAQIEVDFDLIMVTEQFDESLVLLRELLCWDWGDMTYFKLNSWQDTERSKLSFEGRASLKTWLWADYMLYQHFKKRFDKAVRTYNGNMEKDLNFLRSMNKVTQEYCVEVSVMFY